MRKTTAIVLILAAALVCRADTTTTWRDAQGRVQGTMTTDRYGKTRPRRPRTGTARRPTATRWVAPRAR